jgi:hypothetical protein
MPIEHALADPGDPSHLPWSQERVAGLAEALQDELVNQGVDIGHEMVSRCARAIEAFVLARASNLQSLEIAEALHNAIPAHS